MSVPPRKLRQSAPRKSRNESPDALVLTLHGPKGTIPRGRITDLGCEQELDETKDEQDIIKIKFRTIDDLHHGDLVEFLKEHLNLTKPTKV